MARSYFAAVSPKSEPKLPFTYPALIDSPLILCVDDDPSILELLEDVLTACGMRAICTSDCSTAMKLVTSEPIDLVVLDYQMPQMDGLTLAEQMRRHKSQVPMILFSGALLPCETLDIVSRIIRKGDGALPLADAILETLADSDHAA
jgi:two-component system cell cycle sensor histidine kinase/response regulator CckA